MSRAERNSELDKFDSRYPNRLKEKAQALESRIPRVVSTRMPTKEGLVVISKDTANAEITDSHSPSAHLERLHRFDMENLRPSSQSEEVASSGNSSRIEHTFVLE